MVGFSFNNNDPHIKEELKKMNFRNTLMISLVNPHSDEIINTYRELFRTNNIVPIHDTLGEYCQWIVKQKRMEQFETLLKKN